MSEENVEIVRRVYDASYRRDLERSPRSSGMTSSWPSHPSRYRTFPTPGSAEILVPVLRHLPGRVSRAPDHSARAPSAHDVSRVAARQSEPRRCDRDASRSRSDPLRRPRGPISPVRHAEAALEASRPSDSRFGREAAIRFAWKAALLGARLLLAQGRRGSTWTDLIVVTGSCSGTFLPMGDEFTREGRSLPP